MVLDRIQLITIVQKWILKKKYFHLFLKYLSLQISVNLINKTHLFIAALKLRKQARLREKRDIKDTTIHITT